MSTTTTTVEQTWGHGLGLSSGQRDPVYDLLTPFEKMPERMTGRTVWTREELEADPDRWIRRWTADEIKSIEHAIHEVERQNLSLAQVDRTTFPLPSTLVSTLTNIRDELINGTGIAVLRGLHVSSWTTRQASIAYLGIGSYIGRRVSQNGLGHMLGHVKDLDEGREVNGKGRLYRTHQAQPYHTDDADIVGLLCLHPALKGGESQVVSAHNVYNTLRTERPDVLKQLCLPHWFYDRKGEVSDGEEPVMRTPGFYHWRDRLSMKWDSYYVGALQRFWDKGLLPMYTDEQRDAVPVMEDMCRRLSLEMTLQEGDIQFVANTHNLHARSSYQDANDPDKKRWLQRLWLATSEDEGGWPLPFADSKYAKRGGVQVNKTPESYPLEAE